MRKNRNERGVVRSTGLANHSPRVDLGKEPINLSARSRSRPRIRDFTSASTNAFSLVSLVLLIALIATIIVSPQHRINKEKFTFFSPSQFLSNLSSSTFVFPPGEYLCGSEVSNPESPLFGTVRATIKDPNGRIYRSDNLFSYLGMVPYDFQFVFTINGLKYFTEMRSVLEYPEESIDDYWWSNAVVPVLILTEAVSVDFMTFPDFGVVAEAWESATIFNWTNALSATGKFFSDMISYQTNLFTAILPWNTVSSSEDVTDMQIPWRDERNNYIES